MASQCGCTGELCTSRMEILKSLPQAKQEQLTGKALHSEYRRGETIFYEGDPLEAVYLIRSGRIKLNRYDADGKEYILDIRTDGESIGEGSIFAAETAEFNAVCVTDVKLCQIRRRDMHELVTAEPELAWNIIKNLSDKLRQANDRLLMLQENDAVIRISRFLLERLKRVPDGEINLTIDDIAASVGLRKETISRKLGELETAGLISRSGQRRIRLVRPRELKEMLENTGKLI